MATCKWCARSGFFLSVDIRGLCGNCQTIINLDVNQRVRIIKESLELVEKSKNLEVVVTRFDLILQHFESLTQYEIKGISVFDTPPSKMLTTFTQAKELTVVERLKEELKAVLNKYELATTVKSKITILSKFLLRVREYKEKVNKPSTLVGLENQISDLINQTQLNEYLDQAKKAEFKGNKKKALDEHYEALYFLQNDNIDDRLQAGKIGEIEAKIRELSGIQVIDVKP